MSGIVVGILVILSIAMLRIAWALTYDLEFIKLWEQARDEYRRKKAEKQNESRLGR